MRGAARLTTARPAALFKRLERLHDEQDAVVTLQCWDTLGGYAMHYLLQRSNRAMDVEHSGFRFSWFSVHSLEDVYTIYNI